MSNREIENVVISKIDEQAGVLYIDSSIPVGLVDALHIPRAGIIEPQPDPVYGHTFKMPDLSHLKGAA